MSSELAGFYDSAPVPVDPTESAPVRLSTKTTLDESRVTLFYLDDKPYTVPRRPRPNLALKFMWQTKTEGEEQAGMNLLVAMIGEDGFRALMDFDGLSTEDFETVMAKATDLAMGSLESTGKD